MKQDNVIQLPLFSPEPHPPVVQPSKPAEVFTFADVVRTFLHKPVSRAGVCRGCGCSESDPCGLHNGDHCIINTQTGYCSAPKCQSMALPLRKVVGR